MSHPYFCYRRGFTRIDGKKKQITHHVSNIRVAHTCLLTKALKGTLMLTTDMGWGCSHRSAQMLAATCLVLLKLGRDFRLGKQTPVEFLSILSLFEDTPSAPIGIHALSLAGSRGDSNKKPGDWLGPSTVSVALRGCINANVPWGLKCVVCNNAIIYRDMLPANGPVLILLPLRLGLDSLNPSYISLLKAVFECDMCVGIIGGNENASLYFLGYQGDQVLFMDPHTVLPAFSDAFHLLNVDPFRCAPRAMHISAVDPSLSIGFLCIDRNKVDELKEFLQTKTGHLPFSLSVEDGPSPESFPSPASPRMLSFDSQPSSAEIQVFDNNNNRSMAAATSKSATLTTTPPVSSDRLADDWVEL